MSRRRLLWVLVALGTVMLVAGLVLTQRGTCTDFVSPGAGSGCAVEPVVGVAGAWVIGIAGAAFVAYALRRAFARSR